VAAHTISGQRWADGTTVAVYPAEAWANKSAAPSGSAVTSAVVSGGSVTFSPVEERVRYVAYAGGLGVTFVVPRGAPITLADRRRIEELEEGLGDVQEAGSSVSVAGYWNASHADHTVAWQAALVAAALAGASGSRATVVAAEGMQDVAAQLNVPSGVTVTRHPRGSVLRAKAGTSISVLSAPAGASRVEVRDLVIDGNKANVAGGNGINMQAAVRPRIRNVTVLDPFNNGILFDASGVTPSEDGEITGCDIYNPGGHGIALSGTAGDGLVSGPHEFRITRNTVIEPGFAGINLSQSRSCTVVGNTVKRSGVTVTGYGGVRLSNGSSFNTVTGNTIRGTSRGVFIAADALAGDGPCQFNEVKANTITGCQQQGILCEGPYNDIGDNTVVDCCQDAGALDGAIRVSNASYCTVTGGQVIDNAGTKHEYGVEVSGTSDYCVVDGVTIDGWTVFPLSVAGANSKVANINSDASTDVAITGGTLTMRDHADSWNVTGTGTLAGVTVSRKGRVLRLRFNAAVTVTNSATVNLAGATNAAMTAGDVLTLESDGTAWREAARSVN
jgi:hypothetical protein